MNVWKRRKPNGRQFVILIRTRNEQRRNRTDRDGQDEARACHLPETTDQDASRSTASPRSQGSSQRSTSTPRNPGTSEGWQARQMRLLEADRSISGVFSPIRGDQSIPAGTMYRPWNRSELEARYENTMASQNSTGAIRGSRSMNDLTGPSVVNETEYYSANENFPGSRRTVTFEENGEIEGCESGPEPESPEIHRSER